MEIYLDDFISILNLNWFQLIDSINAQQGRESIEKEDLINDWLQFNWEFFVESKFCDRGTFLLEYGEGADCNLDSDRVRYPLGNASFKVQCIPKTHGLIDLLSSKKIDFSRCDFYKFTSYNGGVYIDKPPFDHTLLQDSQGNYLLIKNKDISFHLNLID